LTLPPEDDLDRVAGGSPVLSLNQGYAFRQKVRQGGVVLLDFLAEGHRHSSRAVWAARIAAGEVQVDGQPVPASTILGVAQEVVWNRPPWEEPAADTRFGLVFEDEHLLAVTKPRGLPTLPGGGFLQRTLLAAVRAAYPEASPMHRLGRGTSGLVLFARSPRAGASLQQAWRDHAVRKTYLALGAGVAGPDRFTITVPIGPVAHPVLGTLFAASEAGKPSRSFAQVLERWEGRTLFEVDIESGRPHQIRIHLAFIGHPLVGDPLYGPGGLPLPAMTALPGDGGYFLHAARLRFAHPVTGTALDLQAEPPAELRMRPGDPPRGR
jgi:23S rRNA pseudouridine1911/1915/1917 synthase